MLLLAEARTWTPERGGLLRSHSTTSGTGVKHCIPRGPSSVWGHWDWEHKQGTTPLFPYMQQHLSTLLQPLNTIRKNCCLRGITYCLGMILCGLSRSQLSWWCWKQTNKKTRVIAPGLRGINGFGSYLVKMDKCYQCYLYCTKPQRFPNGHDNTSFKEQSILWGNEETRSFGIL